MEPLYKKFSSDSFNEKGEFAEFSLHYEHNFNFGYDVVDEIGRKEPEKRAVVWCNEEGDERTLTFGEISELSTKAANYFLSQGIQRGQRVLLMLKRHFEYWYILPALHKIGAVAIPATHMLRADDIAYRLNAAEVKAVVCAEDEELCSRVQEAALQADAAPVLYCVRREHAGFTCLDKAVASFPSVMERVETAVEDPILLYFTSGTTGYPKMVVHNHAYPLAHITTAKYWHCAMDNGLHLTVADTGWAKASWGKIYGQWLCGSAVMVFEFERFDGEKLMHVLEKYNVTTFCAPPTLYRLLVKTGIRPEAFASVQHVSTAGEALQEEIIRLFHASTGLEIMEGYGQSETVLIVGNFTGASAKRGSMGKANPLYTLRLVDDAGNDVETGEPGEIVIDTRFRMPEGLCRSYEKNETANARYWRNGVFHTGDIAYQDAEGYFYYVSRKDDVIKSSGYRIGPFEVESVLIQHPAVMECAITGVPDEERGHLVKATVVLRPGYEAKDELARELQQFVKERTAPYKYPRIVEFTKELPKTISGKICYNVIRNADEKK